ncbi:T9SS type A sorting domain-containing protein [bacterium]|nr:T9SS type A sorting domain-containing protein [bacterium]
MRRIQVGIISCALFIMFGGGAVFADEILGVTAGDGEDTHEATFHFDSTNTDLQMGNPDGTLLTNGQAAFVYGNSMQIFNNGVDYITSLGLRVEGADLAGAAWTSSAFPLQGVVAIDPAIGRFKFSLASQWEGAAIDDVGVDASAAYYPEVAVNSHGIAFRVSQQNVGGVRHVYAGRHVPGAGWYESVSIDAGTNVFNYSDSQKIAINDSSKAICVFEENGRVYANEYNPGTGWYGAVTIDANTGNNASLPQIAINSAGHAFCVFKQADATTARIYANRYSPSSGWGTAVIISITSVNAADDPRIVMNDTGEAFCAFIQADTTSNRVYVTQFAMGTETWQSPVAVDKGLATGTSRPRIAMNSFGQVICAFEESDGLISNVYVNEYKIAAPGWYGAVTVCAVKANTSQTPRIVMNDSARAICVFEETDGANDRIYASEYISGTGWYKAVTIDAGPGFNAQLPQIAMNNDGQAICVFEQVSALYTSQVYASHYTSGSGWKESVIVDPLDDCLTLSAYANKPQVDMNGIGKAFCVFIRDDGVVGDRVYTNKYYAYEVPHGTVQVNYYTSLTSAAAPTPVTVTQNEVEITQRKIEPCLGERTQISYALTKAGLVSIKIYNLQGRLVTTLTHQYHDAGSYSASWGAENVGGNLVASGVYIVHIKTPDVTRTQKVVVIK